MSIKKLNLKAIAVFVVLLVGIIAMPASAQQTMVDLELSLLVDVSSSVDASEFTLQKTGYMDAFQNPTIVAAINNGTYKQIAVNLVYWSTTSFESLAWTLVDADGSHAGAKSAFDFGTDIGNTTRPSASDIGGLTSIGNVVTADYPSLFSNNFDGLRLVIDVSGDGSNNTGIHSDVARDAALAAGVNQINGVVIGGSSSVLSHYTTQVIGGTDAFVLEAATFNDFGGVIQQKISKEIGPGPQNPVIPEPASMLLFGTGIIGAFLRKRKRA